MFVCMQSFCNSMFRELGQHRFDMYQTISIAIEKNDGGDDVARRKTRRPIRADRSEADGRKDVIVIHLKCGIPHDLEPVDHRLDGGK